MKHGYFYELRVNGKPLFVSIFANSREHGLKLIRAEFDGQEVAVKG